MNNRPGFALFVTLAVPTLAACSSQIIGGGSTGSGGSDGSGGSGTSSASSVYPTSSSAVSSTGSGGWTTSSAASGSGGAGASSSSSSTGGMGGACSGPSTGLPSAACTPPYPPCHKQSECIALHDNAGAAAFGLRMANLELTAPAAFTKGIVKSVVASSVTPNAPQCNLAGNGTFSWLLAFDSATGTLTTGGAKPQSVPATAYSFVSEDIATLDGGSLHLGTVKLSSPLDASCHGTSTKGDVNVPIYLDAMASSAVVLPLHQVEFSSMTVSGDHNCIGKFNAVGLDPANGCVPDAVNVAYLPGGKVGASLYLEESDTIAVTPLGQSLCVLLSGDAALYGDGASQMSRCKRTSGVINFQGDWCASTDQPATAQCHDAVRFAGDFAASGVKIN